MEHDSILPAGYGAQDAADDRRHLATLAAADVGWRTKRRLRHRVGDEAELSARIVAWDARRTPRPVPARQALQSQRADAAALANEYVQVCSEVWGADDPDVQANAQRIASGDVLPWDARAVITAERERAARLRARGEQVAALAAQGRTRD